MIERVWRGWIAPERADAYRRFLEHEFFPAAHAIPGYVGARIFCRDSGDEVEFMTITRFLSIEAIRAFAGDDIERAHIAPRARSLLTRWDERATHYELAFEDRPETAI